MRSIPAVLAVFALTACARTSREAIIARPPATLAPAREPWAEDIAAFEAADRRAPPPPHGVLFVGSSSIRLWPSLTSDFPGVDVVQRGFGGSELGDVVHFAPRIVLPYKPRLIVLYAGDNDIAEGKSPEDVFRSYEAFVALVRRELPEARIAWIAIKPSGARWGLVDKMRAANALVKRRVATDPHLLYVDVFTPMLDGDGLPREELFVADRLHMNARGYALWRELIAPIVRPYTR
ncbi:MAG: SGNH/GDSL hydrolase family protein [Gemmatimonadaceae bacterium]